MHILKNKPLIGISTNSIHISEKPFVGYQRIFSNNGYIDSVIKAGGVPVLMPMTSDEETIDQLTAQVDGIVLSGGQDVHPSFYNEKPHALLESTAIERDKFEMRIFQNACKLKKPVLGICRGLQLINVAMGGTLFQDLSLHSAKGRELHRHDPEKHIDGHKVKITQNSPMQKLFGQTSIITNSFHHQGIKKLGHGLESCAFSEDGVIEGIYAFAPTWILAVQWHPEVMTDTHPEMRILFEALVKQADGFNK